jgi:competence protein ComEA
VVPVQVPEQGVTCLPPEQARRLGLFPGAVWLRGPQGEPVYGPPSRMPPRRLLAAQVRLDLATATQAELEALPDIGPHLAQRIVAVQQARAARGEPPLRTRAELLRVAGIGERKLERLLPFLNPLP